MEGEEDIFAPLLSFFPDTIPMIDELEGRVFDPETLRQEKKLTIFSKGIKECLRNAVLLRLNSIRTMPLAETVSVFWKGYRAESL